MIDTRELRYGNLVTIDNPIHWKKMKDIPVFILKVESYDGEDFPKSNGHCGLYYESTRETFNQMSEFINPILLTEDILLKLGFELQHMGNKHYTINDPNGYKDSHKISIFPTMNEQWHIAFSDNLGGYKDYIPTTKVQYLHKLQNLYFALTNKELTIQLN